MSRKALIVEDDQEIAELLSLEVGDLGYVSDIVQRGDDATLRALANSYAFILLDLSLPGMNGLEVCKAIRERDKFTPIIVLTARNEDLSKVLLIELGADDYITKPFNPLELKARIKAILRRSTAQQAPAEANRQFRYRELEVDLDKRKVKLRGNLIELTKREYEILATLISSPGRPFSRTELISEAYGYEAVGYEQSISSHVNRLREKIEADSGNPKYVLTVRGVGYCFTDADE